MFKKVKEEKVFIKTQKVYEDSAQEIADPKIFNKSDLKINLDQVIKQKKNQYDNLGAMRNQDGIDSLRELKLEEGPLLTFDKKRRDAGNRKDSEEDSQNKSTSRFGKFTKDSQKQNKKVIKTHREVRKTKKKTRKFISESETVVKRQSKNQSVSPFTRRLKIEKKKLERIKNSEKLKRDKTPKVILKKSTSRRKKINSDGGNKVGKISIKNKADLSKIVSFSITNIAFEVPTEQSQHQN